MRVGLFCQATSDRMRGNGFKSHQGRSRLDMMKNSFSKRAGHRRPTEVVESPAPEGFERHLGTWLWWPRQCWVNDWTFPTQTIPRLHDSHPNIAIPVPSLLFPQLSQPRQPCRTSRQARGCPLPGDPSPSVTSPPPPLRHCHLVAAVPSLCCPPAAASSPFPSNG